jgi:hypothetical protein
MTALPEAKDGEREAVEAAEKWEREWCDNCGGMAEPSIVDRIWDIVHMAGGPISEEAGKRQIAAILAAQPRPVQAGVEGS